MSQRCVTPRPERGRYQTGVEVSGITGNFCGQPAGPLKFLPLVGELDLRNYEAGIATKELIDFPGRSCVLQRVTILLKGRPIAKGQQRFAIVKRDLVLKLRSCSTLRQALDGEVSATSGDPNTDCSLFVAVQVSLAYAYRVALSPSSSLNEKLPLNLCRHALTQGRRLLACRASPKEAAGGGPPPATRIREHEGGACSWTPLKELRTN